MKKFILIFSIFLFLSFNMNTITSLANIPEEKVFSQGFYNMKDLGLSENIPYSIQNISSSSGGLLIIVNDNEIIQQVIRVSPQSPKYALIPLSSNYKFIVYGNVNLVFS